LTSTRSWISCSTSSTWRVAGRTSTVGSTSPVGPHQLLDDLPGVLLLVGGRRGRDEHHLAHLGLELLELQRPVVERARQPEAVFDQHRLARPVAVEHAAELADQHVALVEEHQRVCGR
jgi:hypothetical protein